MDVSVPAPSPSASCEAQPIRVLRFDYAVLAASVWFIGGLLVDGWAHNHLDLSREGFFTPYHALFYSGFAAVAATVIVTTWRNRATSASWRAAIPTGYAITVAGLGIFAIGGACDMLWHIAFGIEQDVEALFSPTHLVLAVGIGAILAGPIAAAIARRPARSWSAQAPGLLALAMFVTLIVFFLIWAFGISAVRAADPHIAFPTLRGDALDTLRQLSIERGISAIVFRSAIYVAVVLWAARRLALPRGAAAFLIVLPTLGIAAVASPSVSFVSLQFAAACAAGLVAEIMLAKGLSGGVSRWRDRSFAFGIPGAFWATYVALASLVGHGFWWSPHVIYGAPVIGGLAGLLLAIAMESHRQPPELASA